MWVGVIGRRRGVLFGHRGHVISILMVTLTPVVWKNTTKIQHNSVLTVAQKHGHKAAGKIKRLFKKKSVFINLLLIGMCLGYMIIFISFCEQFFFPNFK